MDSHKKRMLARVEARVVRQSEELQSFSRQPRYSTQDTFVDRFFGSVMNWLSAAEGQEPAWDVGRSRDRDAWLRQFWPKEPHLAGVIHTVTTLDKNRGWSLSGGRNQVIRYQNILKDADQGAGWRSYFQKSSLSFWTADMGCISENGREEPDFEDEFGNILPGGPLRAIYSTDPAKYRLTGDVRYPLAYYPKGARRQLWTANDYFRVTSLETNDEDHLSLGYCAVSRVLELAKLMTAIYTYDNEQLGARAPKGLLLLHNVEESAWQDAMRKRAASLQGLEREYFGSVAVLASAGVDQVDAKLVALSQLPDQFDRQVFIELLMAAYALCFGYDVTEFWPAAVSGLGRSTEAEVQHVKATGKGGLDFILSYQDGIQNELPDTLEYQFEQRDTEGEIQEATVALAKAELPQALFSTAVGDQTLITWEEARIMLAENDIIPKEWTEFEEDVEATDTSQTARARTYFDRRQRDELMSRPAVIRSAMLWPDEPIIRYQWPSDRIKLLWPDGDSLLRRMSFPSANLPRSRDVLFEGDGFVISDADVARALRVAKERDEEYHSALTAPVLTDEQIALLAERAGE